MINNLINTTVTVFVELDSIPIIAENLKVMNMSFVPHKVIIYREKMIGINNLQLNIPMESFLIFMANGLVYIK